MPAESAIVAAPRACNVLLIYPRFAGGTFWNFAATCEVFGARYPAAPLGLITVAALLPSAWAMRLVDRNTEELTDGDLAWADLVMTGGMLPQQHDTLEIIDICRAPASRSWSADLASPRVHTSTSGPIFVFSAKPKASSTSSSRPGRRERRRAYSRPRSSTVDVTENSDPPLRPAEVRSLPPRRRAVLARLSIHLRVLRHHRALWPGAARQDQCPDAGRAGGALSARLSRPRRLRRRQSHRQQEGREVIPARAADMARGARLSVRIHHRSLGQSRRRRRAFCGS